MLKCPDFEFYPPIEFSVILRIIGDFGLAFAISDCLDAHRQNALIQQVFFHGTGPFLTQLQIARFAANVICMP